MTLWAPPFSSLKSTLDQQKPQAGLYIVSTPIGNLADLSLRALQTLGNVDLILCEDTRISQKLLKAYDIQTPLKPYHDHNGEQVRPKVLQKLQEGASVALISDAGTPLISDPGYKLVQACYEENLYVTAIPGPSAHVMALTLSGLPSDQFFFGGFIPPKAKAREDFLIGLQNLKSTLIFYETGPRLEKSLRSMQTVLGDRSIALARELTKTYEEVRRGRISEICERIKTEGPPKGEIVLVVQGCLEPVTLKDEKVKQLLIGELEKGSSMKDAVQRVSENHHLPRRRVYKLGLEISHELDA